MKFIKTSATISWVAAASAWTASAQPATVDAGITRINRCGHVVDFPAFDKLEVTQGANTSVAAGAELFHPYRDNTGHWAALKNITLVACPTQQESASNIVRTRAAINDYIQLLDSESDGHGLEKRFFSVAVVAPIISGIIAGSLAGIIGIIM